MNYDDYPHPIRRSPRAAHELQEVFDQLHLENHTVEWDGVGAGECSDSDEDLPPPIPRRRAGSYHESPPRSPGEPPPRAPAHINPLRSHPIAAARTIADHGPAPAPAPAPAPNPAQRPAPRYRFSHPFREQLCASRPPDPAPRRHPKNLVSYKPVNRRLHPQLRRRTSLDTIASVTTTGSARDAEYDDVEYDDVEYDDAPDVETPSSMFTLESDYPITPNIDLGRPPMSEPPKPPSLPSSLRTASIDSIPSMPPTTPVSSTETLPPKGVFRKLKSGKMKDPVGMRKDSAGIDGGADRLVIERRISVDQKSHRSNSSSASNTVSSGTPSRYPNSEAGNSRSSSTWTASSHDISGLTPEELKKCKKKGINPSLFAEMKAARKGKWTSPIAGNTFLA